MKTWEELQRPETVIDNIALNARGFLTAFTVILFVSYGLLFAVDFLPEPVQSKSEVKTVSSVMDGEDSDQVVQTEPQPPVVEEPEKLDPLPSVIIFDSLDKEIVVNNPKTNDIPTLDAALQSGAVRHPDSANMLEEGNVFILGHSSRLPNVINRNYQAFNDIEDLEWGDTIRLQTEDGEYIYRVDKVYKAKASEVTVPIANTGSRLTLATCNSFGSKDDRFIVEATLEKTVTL